MNIAILGATSHIAKGLIINFLTKTNHEMSLFGRSNERINNFLLEEKLICDRILNYTEFFNYQYDVIINCVGIGRPEKIKEAGYGIFLITENFDNLVIEYLGKQPQAIYINFSSGAVFGKEFGKPIDKDSSSSINVNSLDNSDAYGLAKLNSEAKHRALSDLHIVDIRIFSYFSNNIDLESKFLLSEVVSAINNSKILFTNKDDIVRDYIHPLDLFQLINCCIGNSKTNDVFDAYSKKPITKFELFDALAKKYNFKYKIKSGVSKDSSTGAKNVYYSINHKAKSIGYNPKYTSLEAISEESSIMIRTNHE